MMKTITAIVSGDMLDEGDLETFSILLDNPVNANLTDDTGAGVILDDDTSTISLENSQPVSEGNLGTASLTFAVTVFSDLEEEPGEHFGVYLIRVYFIWVENWFRQAQPAPVEPVETN